MEKVSNDKAKKELEDKLKTTKDDKVRQALAEKLKVLGKVEICK